MTLPYLEKNMKRVKFKEDGKWADSDTTIPQLEVKAGEEHDVSIGLADIIVSAGKGEYVVEPPKATAKKKTPATKDKAAAESK